MRTGRNIDTLTQNKISLMLRRFSKLSNFHSLPHIRRNILCTQEWYSRNFVGESLYIDFSIACWWPCHKSIICNIVICVFSSNFISNYTISDRNIQFIQNVKANSYAWKYLQKIIEFLDYR